MSDLATFARHAQEVVNDAFRPCVWKPEEQAQYMAEMADRRKQWDKVARHLIRTVVRPRLETIAKLFPNAVFADEQLPHLLSCRFEYSERFPAYTTMEFSIEHDIRFEKVILHTRTHIMPVFVRYNEQDNLLLPLDAVNDADVADWIEERLLEFLDTYLRLDSVGETATAQSAVDPVCGMLILQSAAAAMQSYCGHPYYFCSEECLVKFDKDPTQYVQIKTM